MPETKRTKANRAIAEKYTGPQEHTLMHLAVDAFGIPAPAVFRPTVRHGIPEAVNNELPQPLEIEFGRGGHTVPERGLPVLQDIGPADFLEMDCLCPFTEGRSDESLHLERIPGSLGSDTMNKYDTK